MGKTVKVKTTGRYGARYGVGIRRRLLKVEVKQKQKHKCPDCGFKRVKRTAAGIFVCTKCDAQFAGGSYFPKTMTGSVVKKIILQKAFGQTAEEMLQESTEDLQQETRQAKGEQPKKTEKTVEEVEEKEVEEKQNKTNDSKKDKKEKK